jgi:alkylation response protein AidB-like acyl-CoA dehydrogenase
MNFLLSPEQTQIVDSLRELLTERMPVARFRPPAPQVGNRDRQFWRQLGELGFLGISLDEHAGGIGLTAAEEMLVYREFGRYLLSPAILGMTVGARLAARAHATLLAPILSGQLPLAIANPRGAVTLGNECSGEFHLFDANDAEWVLVCGESGAALLARGQFTDVTEVLGTDHVLALQRAYLNPTRPAIWVDNMTEDIYSRVELLISAYAVGIAEATRDMAVEYAKTRQQFGKAIGSFQAIKHLCADMAIRAEAALCQVIFAALVESGPRAESEPRAAPEPRAEPGHRAGARFHSVAARLVAIEAALQNGAQNIQVHGAIGFTAEAEAHLFIKRAHVLEQLWGNTRQQRRQMLAAEMPQT